MRSLPPSTTPTPPPACRSRGRLHLQHHQPPRDHQLHRRKPAASSADSQPPCRGPAPAWAPARGLRRASTSPATPREDPPSSEPGRLAAAAVPGRSGCCHGRGGWRDEVGKSGEEAGVVLWGSVVRWGRTGEVEIVERRDEKWEREWRGWRHIWEEPDRAEGTGKAAPRETLVRLALIPPLSIGWDPGPDPLLSLSPLWVGPSPLSLAAKDGPPSLK